MENGLEYWLGRLKKTGLGLSEIGLQSTGEKIRKNGRFVTASDFETDLEHACKALERSYAKIRMKGGLGCEDYQAFIEFSTDDKYITSPIWNYVFPDSNGRKVPKDKENELKLALKPLLYDRFVLKVNEEIDDNIIAMKRNRDLGGDHLYDANNFAKAAVLAYDNALNLGICKSHLIDSRSYINKIWGPIKFVF